LHDWYVVAPREYTGTITTSYVMPWVRIGHRVRLRRANGERLVFYVEGVQHEYHYPGSGQSSFHVTRGEKTTTHNLHDIYEELGFIGESLGEMERRQPGGELTLTEAQERTIRELSLGALGSGGIEDRILVGALASDPALAVDESGSPPGGERLLDATASARVEGDSQTADPSMNFRDTAPRTVANGIDDPNNAPPEPTENADPLENITNVFTIEDPFVISLDEEFETNSVGASIPEPEE